MQRSWEIRFTCSSPSFGRVRFSQTSVFYISGGDNTLKIKSQNIDSGSLYYTILRLLLDLFSNLKIHQRNKKPPLTPPRPPLIPPKEGSGVVSYRLAKRSSNYSVVRY
ncbi:MAG: hypothetical protein LBC74_12375 [Planctomycetaceae bacterium]|nr:hypothetical protein [Planctomycetaceae bacterium]